MCYLTAHSFSLMRITNAFYFCCTAVRFRSLQILQHDCLCILCEQRCDILVLFAFFVVVVFVLFCFNCTFIFWIAILLHIDKQNQVHTDYHTVFWPVFAVVQRWPELSSLISEKETWIKSQPHILIKLPWLSSMDLKEGGLNSSYNGNISKLIWQYKQKEVINKSKWNYIVAVREWLRKGHKDYKNQMITVDCFYIKKKKKIMPFRLQKRKKEKEKHKFVCLYKCITRLQLAGLSRKRAVSY